MESAFSKQQAVALNSFLEAAILLGIFSKIPNKIAASKEKQKTYLLPSLKIKNHSLTAMVCNLIL